MNRLAFCLTLSILTSFFPASVYATSVKKLPVPFYYQQRSLSCEIATLRMVLAYHRVPVSENDLLARLPFDRTPRRAGVWGNPHTGFVGRITGSMGRTGYGVYWQPIADMGSYWRRSEVVKNLSASDLTRHIDQKRPIIIWGYYGRATPLTWRTPAGAQINAVNGEHTRVVIGYRGYATDPEGFYVLDPFVGEQYWSTSKLLQNMSSFSRAGVVVYPNPQWVRVKESPTIWEISADGKTRHAVTMSWDAFFKKYRPKNIVLVHESYLARFTVGSQKISNASTLP